MINIYDIQNTDFSNNGDATVQAIRCDLKIDINGGWTLELEIPYDKDGTYQVTQLGNPLTKVSKVGKWNLIQEGAVIGVDIACVREQVNSRQLFRVYDYKRTLTSVVAVAFPIAMECNQDVLINNLAINGTASQVMSNLQTFTNKYTLATNINNGSKGYNVSHTNLGSAIALTFIDVFGGEVMYDNFTIRANQKLGDQNNASKYPVIYGRNITGIQYERDDSGIATRIHPISKDGIELDGTGYVDSPIINNYPYIHKRYLNTPYQLVVDNETDNSETAVATRTALSAIKTASMSPAKTITLNLIHGEVPVPLKYINKIKSSNENEKGIVEAVQAMATAEIYHDTLLAKAQKAIKDGLNDETNGAFAVEEHEWTWHEDTSVTPHAWWYGYDSNEYARNQYVLINKKYEYFNDDGYWEEYKTIESLDWYQNSDGSWSIGYREGWYAHNEFVYVTVDGQMKEWWYDKEGWYDADSSGDSDFGWHGDSSSGIWFGEEDATSEEKNKYLHDKWAFIDGTYYFFDQYGFTDADPVHSMPDYPWGDQTDEVTGKSWFGNPDKSIGAKWIYNQWIQMDGEYWFVNQNGYVRDEKDSRNAVVNAYVTGLASLKTVCNTQRDNLYTLLYHLMRNWCNQQYSNGVDKPKLTLSVDIVDLSKTTEYKNYEYLEKICLGDKVDCRDAVHDIYSTERVMGLTYDCIRGYNTTVTIGHTEASLGSVLSTNSASNVAGGFDTSAITSALTTQGNSIANLQATKQDKLTAGQNITINGNVISATGGCKYRELTQEEYDALPDSKNSDGIIYFIKLFKKIEDDSGIVVTVDLNGKTTWYFNDYSYVNQQDLPVPTELLEYLPEVTTEDPFSTATSAYYHTTGDRDGWIGFVFNLNDRPPFIRAWDSGWGFNAGRFDGKYIVGESTGDPNVQINEYHYVEGEDVPLDKVGKIMLNGVEYTSNGGSEVSLIPALESGTKIADYEVDGTSGGLYAPIKPLTQAEYDALPSSKLTDGIAYFIENIEQYDSSYEFHEYEDGEGGKIVVRIHGNETKWFFMGWHQTSGEMAIPSELFTYRPADPYSAIYSANYPNGGTVQDGWIGFYNDNIRAWSQNLGVLVTGVMYGVVDIDGGADQTNPYENPYGTTEYKIVLNGHRYGG